MVGAINKLHKAGIAHRDIRPENIMITSDGTVKVIDLGFAYALSGRAGDGFHRTKLGNLMYMAPEMLSDLPY